MKLKIFLMTLLLFLACLNGGILVFSLLNLHNSLGSVKERCLGEHYFLISSYAKDASALEQRGIERHEAMRTLFATYADYYSKGKVRLTLSQDSQLLFFSFPEGLPSLPDVHPEGQSRVFANHQYNGREYLTVTGAMPEPYAEFTLTYFYDCTEIIRSWQQMTIVLFSVGVGLSVLFSACLILVIRRVFRPLKRISTAAKSIAHGQYADRLPVRGSDELAVLSENFNHMASEIQSQIAQLQEAAEQKQRFIDNLAHELRTPLTSIYGYAEYMNKAALSDEDKQDCTSYIMKESRHMQNISNRLLDLATLRTDPVVPVDVPLGELFGKLRQTMQVYTQDKEVSFTVSAAFDTLPGDPDLLENLLWNLLENAVKACGEGGQVTLEAFLNNQKKCVRISDTGKGIPPEHLARITEPFYRVDKARSRAMGGAGLGLALCQQIAELHHADIQFFSEPEKGTQVLLTFTTP